jgi:PhzF family phenazine biosynthesis protein
LFLPKIIIKIPVNSLPLFQIDAFTDKVFGGNPAAVIPLEEWLSTETMQKIAAENNLSETTFIYQDKDKSYHIRWFTPAIEVDLCGHATVAAAYYLFKIAGITDDVITFQSKSGELFVTEKDDWFYLDFPAMDLTAEVVSEKLTKGMGTAPRAVYKSKDDWQLIYESQEEIENLDPDFNVLKSFPVWNTPARGIIATAESSEAGIDFVSRFFAPAAGINEDPVTGSAHTKLIPYWAKELNKTEMVAKQLSQRGGFLKCTLKNDRVLIGGQAVLYMVGNIYI